MRKLLNLPHRVRESTCFWNGLEDIFTWKGTNYPEFLLPSVGGMSGFVCLNYARADPPHQAYWGQCPKYFLRNLAELMGFKQTIIEGGAFKNMFSKLKGFIDDGQPVMAGALDMYYLHYFPILYQKIHVPIHYVLVVGYDDAENTVLVNDCTCKEPQSIPIDEFKQSLNVSTPGMSKKNTLRAFSLPEKLPSEFEVAKKGFHSKAKMLLNPPISFLGIPAMRKTAKEIVQWDNRKCFEHLVTFATTPPMLPRTFEDSNGMRFWQAEVLYALGSKYHVDCWVEASGLFHKSGKNIIGLCEAALNGNIEKVSDRLLEVADLEEEAYKLLLTFA